MNVKISNLKCLWTIRDYSNYFVCDKNFILVQVIVNCLFKKKKDLKTDWIIRRCGMNESVWFAALAVGKHGRLWHWNLAK